MLFWHVRDGVPCGLWWKGVLENRVLGLLKPQISPRGPTMVGRGVCSHRGPVARETVTDGRPVCAARVLYREMANVHWVLHLISEPFLESSSTSSVYYGSILIDFKLLSLAVFTLR